MGRMLTFVTNGDALHAAFLQQRRNVGLQFVDQFSVKMSLCVAINMRRNAVIEKLGSRPLPLVCIRIVKALKERRSENPLRRLV